MKWICNAITLKNPLQFKFEFALRTRKMIQTVINERFGIRLSLASIGRLLAQLGLTCQKPLMRAFQQSPALVEKWLKEEYPQIRTRAKRVGVEIFFGDEVGIRSDFHSGRTWAPKGQTPVVRATGGGKIAAGEFCEFLRRLVYKATRPIFLILDGHPVHRSAKVKQLVESFEGELQLFFLPPHSPELNPDESGWNDLKNNGIGRMAIAGPSDLKRKVFDYLRQMQRLPVLIRSFFHAASLLCGSPMTTY
jgi:transposase